MSMHLVTGATGLVGSALVLELLQQTDNEILCLVRPEKGDIETRLYHALSHAALLYGYDQEMLALIQQRCSALAGDISLYRCGCSLARAPGAIEHFWHCAATLKYEDWHQEEIEAINVQGTRHALDLARRLHAASFNYVSSAYVAGKRSGLLFEELFADEGSSNNLYLHSKLQAEHLVAHATDVRTRIFRPASIVGHSCTYAVSNSNWTGLYALARILWRMKAHLSRLQSGYLTTEAPQFCINPAAPMNLIPIDAVARQMVAIGLSPSTEQVFHITNSTPPAVLLVSLLVSWLQIKTPVFVSSRDAFTAFDHQLDQALSFYTPHFLEGKLFDRRNSNAALCDTHAGDFAIDKQMIANYMNWFVPRLARSESALA